jgi:hypothetical protein
MHLFNAVLGEVVFVLFFQRLSYVCAHVLLCYLVHPYVCACARQLSGDLPPPSLKILSVAPLLAEVLKRLAADEGFPHLRLSKL